MTEGPFEYVLVGFPDEGFRAELVSALIDLVGFGTVRILDLIVIRKDEAGAVAALEIDELDDELRDLFFDLDGEYDGLLNDSDIDIAARAVAPGHAAVLLIWEDVWAAKFAEDMRRIEGEVIVNERLYAPVVARALHYPIAV
jgi:hypothetical protein